MIKIINENRVNIDTKVPKLDGEGNDKHIIVTVSDPENQIEDLLKTIMDASKAGHSFNVVVDSDYNFFIDGDSSDRIYDITIDEYKEGDD